MTVILQDAFTGGDGTSLDAHTPDIAPGGSAWVEALGNWQITSNAAALALASNGGHATIETGEADCTITVEANSTTTSSISTRDVGIIARWVDVDNHFRIGINAEADQFRIIERAAGVNSILTTIAVTITPGTLYTVQAVLNGATITATLDGANEISTGLATAGQSSTVHGITARETTDRVDDFLVEVAAGGIAHPVISGEGIASVIFGGQIAR